MTNEVYDRRLQEIYELWMSGQISDRLREVLEHDLLVEFSAVRKTQAAPATEEDEDRDPVTDGLMRDALKTHGRDCCPKCGNAGKFVRTALVCQWHGVFGGV